MAFGVKSASAFGANDAVINMVINRSLTWLDSDRLEIITMFRMKPSYHIIKHINTVNLYYIIMGSPSMLTEYLLFKIILFPF